MENISKKEILVNYLKMCDKNDMANVVLKYCDEERGVVFNRHPAKNEVKLGIINDYSSPSQSKISNVSDISKDLKNIIKQKSCQSVDSSVRSICFYKSKSVLESLQKSKEETRDKKIGRQNQREYEATKETDAISEIIDDMCEIVAPEGKGKFLKFIGENYVYVLLENGTYNCYPIELLKLNRSYIKKNSMYIFKNSCKDVALNHTRNILKDMNHLKDYIVKNDASNENIPVQGCLTRLSLKNMQGTISQQDRNYLQGYHQNLLKKRVQVKALNNRYRMVNSSSYVPIDYAISNDVKYHACC
ncbi:hypothetical protein POVWA2_049700 [Plasmodium ovale wallikeri]|uniref:Uncharacterized protein n=1 Tax=Plasmodium ovale wallikeri TaxID=864142 RepID=A0A1A8ZN49_PLAOA|nr:hypothetical protein POVWA1_051000 [Plasmodium ovale wallikeri]SBT45290.1 hypothetical protein POVWA2_049700 [Plasmodium ovale wallikeri]